MEQSLFEAKGFNGTIQLFDNKITITHTGIISGLKGWTGGRDLYLKNISSIQLKKNTLLTAGYIQFIFPGSSEVKGGTMKAGTDENSVIFKKNTESDFIKLKEMIEARMFSNQNNTSNNNNTPIDPIAQIEKLNDLKEKGILTQDEFDQKKKQILGL